MYRRMKNLTWLADSRSNVKSFPASVQDDIGYALYAAQLGEWSVKAKPLRGLGGQVMEKVQGRDRDTEVGDGTDPAAAQTVEE
jgi:phage-related protein